MRLENLIGFRASGLAFWVEKKSEQRFSSCSKRREKKRERERERETLLLANWRSVWRVGWLAVEREAKMYGPKSIWVILLLSARRPFPIGGSDPVFVPLSRAFPTGPSFLVKPTDKGLAIGYIPAAPRRYSRCFLQGVPRHHDEAQEKRKLHGGVAICPRRRGLRPRVHLPGPLQLHGFIFSRLGIEFRFAVSDY